MQNDNRIFKWYFRSTCIAVSVCVLAIFVSLALRSRTLIHEQILTRARAQFSGILLMRRWSAQHEGVYVIKRPGMQSNPYLEDPDLIATDGRVLTLKAPSVMTREISELADKNDLFTFHLTSLRLLNPNNAPDSFENEALHSFEGGQKESILMEEKQEGARFRYMVPLLVEQPCLACHAKQGYTAGQIRGGISVSFGIDDVNRAIRQNGITITCLAVTTLGLLLFVMWLFFHKMQKRLDESQALLRRLATIDMLTDIANRATVMARFGEGLAKYRRQSTKLGCLMLDVDHFKAVNDRFGHQKGDEVLKGLASLISSTLRPYDTFGRYGGEEFLLVLEEVDEKRLTEVAERTRNLVEEQLRTLSKLVEPVTISIGGTLATQEDHSAEDIIRRADQALYMAKNKGRNCVVIL